MSSMDRGNVDCGTHVGIHVPETDRVNIIAAQQAAGI